MLLEMQPEYPYSLVGIMEIIRIPTCDMVFRGSVAPNAGSRLCGVAGVCENEGIWPQFWGHIFLYSFLCFGLRFSICLDYDVIARQCLHLTR